MQPLIDDGCSLEVVGGDSISPDNIMMSGLYSGDDLVLRDLGGRIPEAIAKKFDGVDHLLAAVDSQLDEIPASIGGVVVPHEWCLTEYKVNSTVSLSAFGIKHYALGAKVKIVEGAVLGHLNGRGGILSWPEYNNLKLRLDICAKRLAAEQGWTINDAAEVRQFMIPSKPRAFISDRLSAVWHREALEPKPILVDIEPRLLTGSDFA
ncbi:MAG: hypothetical protein ACI9T8_000195 [Candidatus Saccharimonadales bacterium]|jgi:hypothetical protein